jgi:hypothetical protein
VFKAIDDSDTCTRDPCRKQRQIQGISDVMIFFLKQAERAVMRGQLVEVDGYEGYDGNQGQN